MAGSTAIAINNSAYWLRLILSNDCYVKKGLWNVLHNIKSISTYQGLPQDPSNLYNELKKYKSKLNELKQKKIIKKDQWDLLFPTNKQPQSENFDVTLLAVLIQYCTNLPPPKDGWDRKGGPYLTDSSTAANVLQACIFRNFVYHYGHPSAMKQPEFLRKWNDMENLIKGLGYVVNTIELKTGSLDPHSGAALNHLLTKMTSLQNDVISVQEEMKNLGEAVNKIEAMKREENKDDINSRLEEHESKVMEKCLEGVNKLMVDMSGNFAASGMSFVQTNTDAMDRQEFLQNKYSHGLSLLQQGRYFDATKVFEELRQFEITSGTQNAFSLKVKLQIGICLQIFGKYWDAMAVFKEVYNVQEKIFGELNRETLKTKQVIGECLVHQGKYAEAFDMLQQVYKSQMFIDGVSEDTLTTKHLIGICLRKLGKYCNISREDGSIRVRGNRMISSRKFSDALTVFQNVYDQRKEILGEKHSQTLVTKRNIGICLFRQMLHSEAMDVYKEVYNQQKDLLGDFHPDVLITKYWIGLCLCNQGNYADAMSCLEEVYAKHKEILGEFHPDGLAMKRGIAICLHNQESYFIAMSMYEEVYKLQTQVLGSMHPDSLRTQYNMTLCSLKQFNIRDGVQAMTSLINDGTTLFDKLYEHQRQSLGDMHPHTLETKLYAGIFRSLIDEFDILSFLQDIYESQAKLLGEMHAQALWTKAIIGTMMRLAGDTLESQTLLQETYEVQKCFYGEFNPHTLHMKKMIDTFSWGPMFGLTKILAERLWNFFFS